VEAYNFDTKFVCNIYRDKGEKFLNSYKTQLITIKILRGVNKNFDRISNSIL